MTAPCLNCTERHENCHSECERYREFTAQKPQKIYSVTDEYTLEDVQKKRRRKR